MCESGSDTEEAEAAACKKTGYCARKGIWGGKSDREGFRPLKIRKPLGSAVAGRGLENRGRVTYQ